MLETIIQLASNKSIFTRENSHVETLHFIPGIKRDFALSYVEKLLKNYYSTKYYNSANFKYANKRKPKRVSIKPQPRTSKRNTVVFSIMGSYPQIGRFKVGRIAILPEARTTLKLEVKFELYELSLDGSYLRSDRGRSKIEAETFHNYLIDKGLVKYYR